MSDYSYIFNANPSFIESLYTQYQKDNASVEDGWRTFFEGFEFAQNGSNGTNGQTGHQLVDADVLTSEFKVMALIHGYRDRGHLLSTTNPIKKRKDRKPHIDIQDYGLTDADLDKKFAAGFEIGLPNASLRAIVAKLRKIYTGNIGFEYAHIEEKDRKMWLRERIESRKLDGSHGLSLEKKKRILEKLNGAEIFERFLHTKYIGQKRFSLEGGESLIPALDAIINKAAEDVVEEVIIGMAHRGRLNVLANTLGKTYEHIFNEFEGTAVPELSFGDGDVKYHLGYSSQIETTSDRKIQVKITPNPSHLESVDPVVEGFSRAKADILYGSDYDKILPILIHGDAAVAGQGVVYEVVQMSKLPGYYTGGTMHIVINNQIGFTTNFDEARSSTYSTGIASVVQAPVFHINGDDPESMIFAVELALEYRQKFNNDVFIDMVCYRKHGHNEGDDPKFTQPQMYRKIADHKSVRELYSELLISRGEVEQDLSKDLEKQFWEVLQKRLDSVKEKSLSYEYQEPEKAWQALKKTMDPADFEVSPVTGIKEDNARKILDHLVNLPEGFTPLSKVKRILKGSKKLIADDKLDWALAELTAYSSILTQGNNIRMSGQDVKRGTFSHRHAIFYDEKDYSPLNRLEGITKDQGKFMIYNSLLSEFAVLGFEYGYSLASPDSLVVWEAQFGDFFNGAQVMVDQFITSGESKWQRMSGLVMLLPHGFAGQGPEHSSARLERFLQSAAEYNITVGNFTTPANIFHALRRQLARPFRKPLIVMSPKSLLRHPKCISPLSDITGDTAFKEMILDEKVDAKKAKRLILCSGKIYYDLDDYRDENKITDVSIVRVEQLYPLPYKQIDALLKSFKGTELYWVQEEPENMGSAIYMSHQLKQPNLKIISRKASASPATGFKQVHEAEQKRIVEESFK